MRSQVLSFTSLVRHCSNSLHFKYSFIFYRNTNLNQNYCTDEREPKFFSNKYKIFSDKDSNVIYNVEEEREIYQKMSNVTQKEESNLPSESRIYYSHYFEATELINLINLNKGKDTVVINIPSNLKYVNHLIITTGTSRRHLVGLAELIRKQCKLKGKSSDFVPQIEGANSDWIALDLENIALHIMLQSAREKYDLESLWAIGAKYDILKIEENQYLELLKHHSHTLTGI